MGREPFMRVSISRVAVSSGAAAVAISRFLITPLVAGCQRQRLQNVFIQSPEIEVAGARGRRAGRDMQLGTVQANSLK